MLDGKVSGEPLVNSLGRLEHGVEVGTILGLQEGVQNPLRDIVRNEVEDIRGVRIHLVCLRVSSCGFVCLRVAGGGLKKKGYSFFQFFYRSL